VKKYVILMERNVDDNVVESGETCAKIKVKRHAAFESKNGPCRVQTTSEALKMVEPVHSPLVTHLRYTSYPSPRPRRYRRRGGDRDRESQASVTQVAGQLVDFAIEART